MSRGCLLELGVGYGIKREQEVRRGWSVGYKGDVDRSEGRLHLVLGCSPSDKTEGFLPEEQRARRRSAVIVLFR